MWTQLQPVCEPLYTKLVCSVHGANDLHPSINYKSAKLNYQVIEDMSVNILIAIQYYFKRKINKLSSHSHHVGCQVY